MAVMGSRSLATANAVNLSRGLHSQVPAAVPPNPHHPVVLPENHSPVMPMPHPGYGHHPPVHHSPMPHRRLCESAQHAHQQTKDDSDNNKLPHGLSLRVSLAGPSAHARNRIECLPLRNLNGRARVEQFPAHLSACGQAPSCRAGYCR